MTEKNKSISKIEIWDKNKIQFFKNLFLSIAGCLFLIFITDSILFVGTLSVLSFLLLVAKNYRVNLEIEKITTLSWKRQISEDGTLSNFFKKGSYSDFKNIFVPVEIFNIAYKKFALTAGPGIASILYAAFLFFSSKASSQRLQEPSFQNFFFLFFGMIFLKLVEYAEIASLSEFLSKNEGVIIKEHGEKSFWISQADYENLIQNTNEANSK